MFNVSIRVFFSSLMLPFTGSLFAQNLTFSPSPIEFTQPVNTTSKDSVNITLHNNSCGYFKIKSVDCPNMEFQMSDTTSFWLAPAASKILKVYFLPLQNIEYNSTLIVHTSSGNFSLPIKGYGKFIESYYDSTYNKFDENLKASLNTILAMNYQSYSYAAARDKMFMEFDNKKTNGQGATQNTLECIYTGRLALGYANRTDCQNNNSFNTEHTWPQSLFGSATPMVSDLNHLFPTDDAANNYRSNNPFGMVSNPTWSAGGSKGITTLFEPRDAQKGRTARAMLYFATRYNNTSYGLVSFFGPQESVLRSWCLQFPPDAIDRKRNDDIFGYQKNRNPFIDHPEFLERITSLANTSVAPIKTLLWCDTQQISKSYFVYDSLNYKVVLFNLGNTPITCSKIQSTQNLLTLSYPNPTIAKKTSFEISIRQALLNGNTIIDTLLIENNSTNWAIIKIPVRITISRLKISTTKTMILAANDSAILSIPTNGSITWSTGFSGNILTVKNAGTYYATVTDSNGCHSTDTITITKSAAGITAGHTVSFGVFPNPVSQAISIVIKGNATLDYYLLNAIGQVLATAKGRSGEVICFDVRNYPNGMYLIQNKLGESVKVIIQK